jgi:hypothetical protein
MQFVYSATPSRFPRRCACPFGLPPSQLPLSLRAFLLRVRRLLECVGTEFPCARGKSSLRRWPGSVHLPRLPPPRVIPFRACQADSMRQEADHSGVGDFVPIGSSDRCRLPVPEKESVRHPAQSSVAEAVPRRSADKMMTVNTVSVIHAQSE